jgi:hypothetical protein
MQEERRGADETPKRQRSGVVSGENEDSSWARGELPSKVAVVACQAGISIRRLEDPHVNFLQLVTSVPLALLPLALNFIQMIRGAHHERILTASLRS